MPGFSKKQALFSSLCSQITASVELNLRIILLFFSHMMALISKVGVSLSVIYESISLNLFAMLAFDASAG